MAAVRSLLRCSERLRSSAVAFRFGQICFELLGFRCEGFVEGALGDESAVQVLALERLFALGEAFDGIPEGFDEPDGLARRKMSAFTHSVF